jgi:DNA-binding GntR family transcriptional regulator
LGCPRRVTVYNSLGKGSRADEDQIRTRAEKLREAIEESIATGAFAPGMHLEETELAQRFGVSRTPLREALIQLSSMGIVALRPRRGAVVAEVTPQRLLEMIEVMAELEAMCGRLAARRMSAADQAVMMRAHKACEAACIAQDPDTYYHENEQFHYAIYAGSHSGFLIEQTTAMHRRLRPYRRLQLRVRNRLAMSFSEHNGIVDALIAGDAEAASERLRLHILIQGERFTDLLASLASIRARHDAQSAETLAPLILPS